MRLHAALTSIAAVTLIVDLGVGWNWGVALTAALIVLGFGEALGWVGRRTSETEILPVPASTDLSGAPGRLSRRELEVAILVAQDLTNKEIAARVFLSVPTVDNRVQHIYNRLGIDSRVGLAGWSGTAAYLEVSTRVADLDPIDRPPAATGRRPPVGCFRVDVQRWEGRRDSSRRTGFGAGGEGQQGRLRLGRQRPVTPRRGEHQ